MDADNDDRPHYHIDVEPDYTSVNVGRAINLDRSCLDVNCTADHTVVVALDDYRALVAAARDRHPAGQQRGADPATRADNCICWGYGDDHHTACPACTP